MDIFVIDASGYLYRSYFAIRQMSNDQNVATNALFGFIRSILKLIKDFNPEYLVSVFDAPDGKSSRTKMYTEYKATRSAIPEDLPHQIEWAKEFCDIFGIPRLEVRGVEADDTMGTVARWAKNQGLQTYLCTSDKDLCQLVNDKISILNTHKDNLILDREGVRRQYGVWPEQIIDYLAIVGDSSDNVPGLPGFGPKTAVTLLEAFETLDNILASPEQVPGKKKQDTLKNSADQALLSRQLVTIDTSVSIPHDLDFFHLIEPNVDELREFYLEKGFSSLIKELPSGNADIVRDDSVSYTLVDDLPSLEQLIQKLREAQEVCLDTEATSTKAIEADLVGIGFAIKRGEAWYVPANGKLGLETVINHLKPLFEDEKVSFYGHNVKYDLHILANNGIVIANISFDTILADYILNANNRRHSLDHLALNHFGKVKIPIEDLIGKGKKQISMMDVPIDKVCYYCCEDVDYTLRLKNILEKQLEERSLSHLLFDIELPVMHILLEMERRGIFLDVPHLKNMGKEIYSALNALEKHIYAFAGEEFNINSPKQLSEILFEKLLIPPPKKTATGFSTNADVLTTLRDKYPIADFILQYRTLEKLRSTYIDSLPHEVNPKTQRIHCSFMQFVTATGRLSSQDPNLQNIPTRTEEGKIIRAGFRPQKEGWSFLAADYSQIELRILAHLSNDPALVDAFNNNHDIHAATAAQIFSVPIDSVTSQQRYQAKAVNFGIVYGQQAFGLSQELRIPRYAAKKFIDTYFQQYPRVKEFITECQQQAHDTGKTTTLTGRERVIPEINSRNANLRAAAERLAINSPIQGSAADLIKLAMIAIDKKLDHKYMILQVHDELIFEIPDDIIETIRPIIRDVMENVLPLQVPLVVNISVGKNWKEC